MRNRYFWKYRNEVSLEFLKIYGKLLDRYEKGQLFMQKWMHIVNLYIAFRKVNCLLENKKREKDELQKLKKLAFTLWNKSKKTVKAINQAKQDKVLKKIFRTSLAKFYFRQPVLKAKTHDILQKFFLKVLIIAQLDKRLKRFSVRSNFIS